jgi:short subunit dehydrogenase-like uncharacterized protein
VAYNVLLYGATGFSGGLIAAEGRERGMSRSDGGEFRMVLAARNGAELRTVAKENDMEFRAFALDDPAEIHRRLDGVDVVINAAGPFAFTANALVKAALNVGCHYVDINSEVDVYIKLDDFGRIARQRGYAIVSAAGDTAGSSDILLNRALESLEVGRKDLGTIRFGMSRVADLSRGNATTAMRMLREQVKTVRRGYVRDHRGEWAEGLVTWHEPLGKLGHIFDFDDGARERRRIASAANFVDTLTARTTLERRKLSAYAVESYVEMGPVGRFAYQLGGMLAPFSTLPLVQRLTRAALEFLPEDPGPNELKQSRHTVVLEIEDPYRERLIDWRLETPDVYQFTAQIVVAVARSVALASGALKGWVTPAEALGFDPPAARKEAKANRMKATRSCKWQARTG